MVGDKAVKGETHYGRHDERKNQNRDKSFIHVVSPPAGFRLYMILRGDGLMYDLAGENELDLEALSARVQRICDRESRRTSTH